MKNMLLYKLMLLLLVINLAQGILSDSSSIKKYITKSGILIESGSYLGMKTSNYNNVLTNINNR